MKNEIMKNEIMKNKNEFLILKETKNKISDASDESY